MTITPVPLLIVIAGPAIGRVAPLDREVTIGRDEGNALPIPDAALSRRHCVVDPSGPDLLLKDLGSRNGVFVNGCPVSERMLADGDQIRIGDSAIVVVVPARSAAQPRPEASATLNDTPMPTTSTIALDTATRLYVRDGPAAAGAGSRASRDLAALLQLSEALQTVTASADVFDRLLDAALAVPSADAAVVLAASDDSEPLIVRTRTRAAHAPDVSRPLVAQAVAERVAVLAPAAIAVPIAVGESESSVLYVTTQGAGASFSNDDLQLLAAIGWIGGLSLDRVRQAEWLRAENARLRRDAAIEHNLIGESAAMQAVYRFIARVAPTDATVLLSGESGTGKELVATAIHANSARANGPFVPINCAALPEALLESELFGHERGAFTGAVAERRGRLEMAHRGTVFLDEIGELAPALQAKLLRVLQDHVVERVGARRGIRIDVRVIAATNRNLEAAMAAGAFRQDLYYRLNVVSTTMPPLRERQGDLPLLAAYFVRQHAARCKRTVKGISPAARALLAGHDWPGNVRELSNAIERAVVLGSSEAILPDDLPEALVDASTRDADPQGFHARVASHKRDLIRDALDRNAGHVARTARELGLQPTYLHRLIKNLGV